MISKGSPKTRVPDGSPTQSTGGDVNNNGPTKCLNGACGGYGPSSASNGGGGAGDGPAAQSRRVQVTAKILFGSVNAISTMKQNDKLHRKKSQWLSCAPLQQQQRRQYRRRRPVAHHHRPPLQPLTWIQRRRQHYRSPQRGFRWRGNYEFWNALEIASFFAVHYYMDQMGFSYIFKNTDYSFYFLINCSNNIKYIYDVNNMDIIWRYVTFRSYIDYHRFINNEVLQFNITLFKKK